ncbi:MAG: hypothetical protein KatS3mg031_0379 [Chitinophagales bacterium]|nr:MAG: hypothetical protein KatS3mg031_0379 [Chitinophagales bacterium]
MNVKIAANIILSIVIAGMGFWLYKIIREPIVFEKEKKVRYEKTIQRLKDIRTAQIAYKDLKGRFAKNFDELIFSLKNDSVPVVKAIGDVPDSLTEAQALALGIIIRDTIYEPMLQRTFPQGVELDSLPYIPFTNIRFTINAGEIRRNNVMVPVFEVSAPDTIILRGLNEKFIDPKHELKVGSMTEPTYTGNWE